jgi:hypothetical protein
VPLSSTPLGSAAATQASGVATVPMRFEVTTLPVAEVDRAKAFYQCLGRRLDIDFTPTERSRAVQFTPPDPVLAADRRPRRPPRGLLRHGLDGVTI